MELPYGIDHAHHLPPGDKREHKGEERLQADAHTRAERERRPCPIVL